MSPPEHGSSCNSVGDTSLLVARPVQIHRDLGANHERLPPTAPNSHQSATKVCAISLTSVLWVNVEIDA